MIFRIAIVLVCSVHFNVIFFFVDEKVAADPFKDEVIPLLKENDRLNFAQDVKMNRVREKGKPQCKLSYKLLEE